MKKIVLLLGIFFVSLLSGQTDEYDLATKLIKKIDKSANLENKLILISFWSVNQLESREINKEMQRVSKIYEKAKLKGGLEGVYFLSFCLDTDQANYNIALKKDSISIKSGYLENSTNFNSINSTFQLNGQPNAFLMDSKGNMISKSFTKKEVFNLLLNQITR